MNRQLSHEEIAQRFVDAKVIDFTAMGKLVAELGPTLATNDQGVHGVSFGRYNWYACFWSVHDVTRFGSDLDAAKLTAAAIEKATGAGIPSR